MELHREGTLQRVLVHVVAVCVDKREKALQAVGLKHSLCLAAAQQLKHLDRLQKKGNGQARQQCWSQTRGMGLRLSLSPSLFVPALPRREIDVLSLGRWSQRLERGPASCRRRRRPLGRRQPCGLCYPRGRLGSR